MSVSEVTRIKNDQTMTDAAKVTALYNIIQSTATKLSNLRNALAISEERLNLIMNANGDNSEEHYAKTMMFYGRKFCGKDVMLGVTSPSTKDIYKYDALAAASPFIDAFIGIDTILPEIDTGRVHITWDCSDGMTGKYKSDGIPATTTLELDHCLGTNVTMPTIKNLDAAAWEAGTIPVPNAGTNTYKLKSGLRINGWKLKTANVFLVDDLGVDYLYRQNGSTTSGGVVTVTKEKIPDRRIFGFNDNANVPQPGHPEYFTSSVFKLPFKLNLSPVYPSSLTFILDVVSIWFDITFVVRHGTGADGAPWKTPLKTRLDCTVTIPNATMITMDSGWEMDTSGGQYGTWTTVDPLTGVDQVDPDGDTIPAKEFNGGTQQIIGTDLDAGIRTLYLKIKAK